MSFPFVLLLVVVLGILCACEIGIAARPGPEAPWFALERGRVWARRATLLAGVLFVVLALHPRIAFGQANPDPAPPPATLTLAQVVVVIAAIAGTFGGLMTAIGEALKLLGMKYPALEVTAEHFLALGIDFRKAAALSQVKTAAKRATLAAAGPNWNPPSSPFPPVPPVPPANGFVRREVLGALGAVGLLFLAGCAWFQAHPTVTTDTKACGQCVGTDAIKNESAAVPLPFYPQFCTELLNDCGGVCGKDVVDVISALAGVADPAVQKTGAFREASARQQKMLAPSPSASRP